MRKKKEPVGRELKEQTQESRFLVAFQCQLQSPRRLAPLYWLRNPLLGFLCDSSSHISWTALGKILFLATKWSSIYNKTVACSSQCVNSFIRLWFSCSKEMFKLVGAGDGESQNHSSLFLKLALKVIWSPPLIGWIMCVKIRRDVFPVSCHQPSRCSSMCVWAWGHTWWQPILSLGADLVTGLPTRMCTPCSGSVPPLLTPAFIFI